MLNTEHNTVMCTVSLPLEEHGLAPSVVAMMRENKMEIIISIFVSSVWPASCDYFVMKYNYSFY